MAQETNSNIVKHQHCSYVPLTFAGVIRAQEKEIEELKSKIAQVLAVMPTDTFGPGPTNSSGMSKLRLAETPSPCPGCTVSNLDPNATAYTPKGSLIASTEA
jgi:hypothetical protein